MKIALDTDTEIVLNGERCPFKAGTHDVGDDIGRRLQAVGGTIVPDEPEKPKRGRKKADEDESEG